MISGCYVAVDQYIDCNNGIGGFHENLVTFKRPKTPPPPPLLHPISRSHSVTMESPRGSSAIIMEIRHSSIISFPRCARGTARGFPIQDHGEPKRELCRHHGDRPLVDSFNPMPIESPRGSSAIIMEFCRRTHLI